MTNRLRALNTLADLDAAIAGSSVRPLLVLKHSPTCGTSAHAFEQFETLLAGPPLPVDACIVYVQSGRAVSNAIAQRLGVRHESPQVLLVGDGRVIWHASHHRVTERAIAAALQQYVPG